MESVTASVIRIRFKNEYNDGDKIESLFCEYNSLKAK